LRVLTLLITGIPVIFR